SPVRVRDSTSQTSLPPLSIPRQRHQRGSTHRRRSSPAASARLARSRAARVGLGGDGARPARRRCRIGSGRGRGGGGLASGALSGLSRTRAAEQRRGGGAAAAAPSFSLPKLVFLAGRILLVLARRRRATAEEELEAGGRSIISGGGSSVGAFDAPLAALLYSYTAEITLSFPPPSGASIEFPSELWRHP
ncbi:unnamed protein product, partial [Urochloa humidicola]